MYCAVKPTKRLIIVRHIINVPTLEQLRAMLGKTADNVGDLMRWLEQQEKCVVLFDEVEMLFPSREHATDNCSAELQSAMGVFWQYLDRWEAPTLFVLATNMPDRLDPALMSRVDVKIEFGPPTVQKCRRYQQRKVITQITHHDSSHFGNFV